MKRLLVALVLILCSICSVNPAAAAQTIGYPTFSGPAIPAPPVAYTTGNMMRAIYDAESSRHRLLDGPAAGPDRQRPAPAPG